MDAENKQYAKPEEALKDLQEALNNLFDNPKWMVALWAVDKDDKLHYKGKWTWNFPLGDFVSSLFFLSKDMHNEVASVTEKPQLKLASFLGAGEKPPGKAPQPEMLSEPPQESKED